MIEPSTAQKSERPSRQAEGQLGRWIGVCIAALFVMVILSVAGVFWVAKRNQERAVRLNRMGSAPGESGKPASR